MKVSASALLGWRGEGFPLPARVSAAWLSGLGLAVDQASKVFVQRNWAAVMLGPGIRGVRDAAGVYWAARPPLPKSLGEVGAMGFHLSIYHLQNFSITLDVLETAPPWLRGSAFFATSALGLVVAGLLLARWGERAAVRYGAPLLACGVMGNLLDRVRLGYVIDWWEFNYVLQGAERQTPTANLADIWIALGALLCAWGLWLQPLRSTKRRSAQPAS